jgi:hypothetical protein
MPAKQRIKFDFTSDLMHLAHFGVVGFAQFSKRRIWSMFSSAISTPKQAENQHTKRNDENLCGVI